MIVKDGSLTRRAFLTFVSNILDLIVTLVTGFFFNPVIIRGLGSSLYGALGMIEQTTGYLAFADLRPMGVLKFTLATTQHRSDPEEKRRQMGAAVITWICMTPLLILGGIVFVWAIPWIIHVNAPLAGIVKMAMGISILELVVDGGFSIGANVLRGMNIAYKGMGVRTLILLVSSLLSVLAVVQGWGLPGVVLAGLIGTILLDGYQLYLAKRYIPWLGFTLPKRAEVLRFLNLSGWVSIQALATIPLNASDVLIIGIIFGPSVAGVYVTTGLVLRMASDPIFKMLNSVNSGLAGLLGKGDYKRVSQISREMHIVGLGSMFIIGVGVVILNGNFLRLWVGSEFFGGSLLNLLLVLVAIQYVVIRMDAMLMDGMLMFKQKGFAAFISGVLSILFGLGTIGFLKMSGVVLGMLVGRSIMLIYQKYHIAKRSNTPVSESFLSITRITLVGICLIFIAFAIVGKVVVNTWIEFFAATTLVSMVTCSIIWFVGFTKNDRVALINRLNSRHHLTLGI